MVNKIDRDIHETFIKNIRFLLTKRGLSQNAFAKEIEKNVSHINGLLNGHGNPTLDFVINCSKYFNISIDDLLFKNIEE